MMLNLMELVKHFKQKQTYYMKINQFSYCKKIITTFLL